MTQTAPQQSPDSARDGRRFLFPSLAAFLLFLIPLVAGLALDLWSKHTVFNWLESSGRHSVTIIENFLSIRAEENPGAAFGVAAGRRWLLIAVSVAALLAVCVIFLCSAKERRIVHFSLGLFAAGVCGNLYDRIFNGGFVRDFIDVVYWPQKHWPTFNVADSLLCISVGLLVLTTMFSRKPAQEHAQPQK